MPQTILQTGQAVARSIGVDAPTSIYGNSEDTAQRLLQAMRDAGRALAARDWRALTYEYTFTTVSGTTEYVLPSNPAWHHMVPGTDWDRTNYSRMQGPLGPRTWQAQKGGGLGTTFFARPWRAKMDAGRAVTFALVDDPAGAYTIYYEYVTDQWLYDGSALYVTDINSDANQPVFDAYLFELHVTWRLRRTLGLAYETERADARNIEDRLFAQERATDVSLCSGGDPLLSNNTPEYGYG